jgi:short-subunit dehydrogenase
MSISASPALHHLLERYGPWAVVTGASDGIGRAFAVALAQAGFHLVLVARRAAVLEELAASLTAAHGIQARAFALDLDAADAVDRLIAQTRGLEVGLLIASAGFGTSGDFIHSKLSDELSMLQVNCAAVVALSHHFGSRFVEQRRGGLVLMSSLLAFQGVPRAAHYAATKAFVQTFAEGLRRELKPAGVDVLACAPGPINSGFGQRADMKMGMGQGPEVVAQATLNALGHAGTVRPGWLSKLLEGSLMFLPRWGRVLMLERIMGGMTKHRPTLVARS